MSPKYLLCAGRVITPFIEIEDAAILVSGQTIEWMGPRSRAPNSQGPDVDVIDLGSCSLAPGFIDIHIHGGGGRHTGDSKEALLAVAEYLATQGTTSFLPTLGGVVDFDELLDQVRMVEANRGRQGLGAEVAGIHLEGPFLSPDSRVKGAQSVAAMRTPSVDEFDRIYDAAGGALRYMTIAPELPDAFNVIRRIVERGVVPSAGHTSASYEEMDRAISLGLSSVCHTFNGMVPLHHRQPGVVGAALTRPELNAELIGDGHHVSDVAMRLLYKMKGAEGICLITDNTRWAGVPDGRYGGDGRTVVVSEGRCVMEEGGSLAGSVAPMNAILHRFVEATGCPVPDALRMASHNPAKLVGLSERKGSLEPGKDADIVAFDDSFEVALTMVGGQVVYRA